MTFSEEPCLPDLEDAGDAEDAGKAFESGAMVVFACLVLVLLAPSGMVVDRENGSLRNAVEPLRAFVFVSVLVPVP